MKLDLGGTGAGWEEPHTSISLDGSHVESDYDTVLEQWWTPDHIHTVIGTYRTMPFPDNTFDEAFGSCFLEGSDEEGFEGTLDWKELARVMKLGATIRLSSCHQYVLLDPNDDIDGPGEKQEADMFLDALRWGAGMEAAGLRVVSVDVRDNSEINTNEDNQMIVRIDTPTITIRKEWNA
jgi:hypothetical protein